MVKMTDEAKIIALVTDAPVSYVWTNGEVYAAAPGIPQHSIRRILSTCLRDRLGLISQEGLGAGEWRVLDTPIMRTPRVARRALAAQVRAMMRHPASERYTDPDLPYRVYEHQAISRMDGVDDVEYLMLQGRHEEALSLTRSIARFEIEDALAG